MDFHRIRPSTIALALAAGFMLLVGTYTENGGFQLAGILLAVVAGIVALNQARSSRDSDKGGSE